MNKKIVIIAVAIFVAVAAILMGVFGVFTPNTTTETGAEETIVETVDNTDTVEFDVPEETPCING